MFSVVCKVGSNIGVYDSDDSTVEFISKHQVIQYLKSGITIAGATLKSEDELSLVVCDIILDSRLFNYNNGQNIFRTATSVRRENCSAYSFVSGKKKYRCTIISCVEMNMCLVRLSNGLLTYLSQEFFY